MCYADSAWQVFQAVYIHNACIKVLPHLSFIIHKSIYTIYHMQSKQAQIQAGSWHFNLTVILSFQIQHAEVQSQCWTLLKLIICSVVLQFNVLHHRPNLFQSQYASQHYHPWK